MLRSHSAVPLICVAALGGCRLLAVDALPCEQATDCPYPYVCVDQRCAPPGPDAGNDPPGADAGGDRGDAGDVDEDAGTTDVDAGATNDDAGATGNDAGVTGYDAGLPIDPDCGGPGAVREDFSTDLSRWAMSTADGSITIGPDAALHVAAAAATSVSGGMTTFFVLDAQGLRARVTPVSGPPPADGFFKIALRALAADPVEAYDRVELQWSGDGLRVNLESGTSDVQIGATLAPYDPIAYPVWRIRRSGSDAVLEVSDDSGAQVVEVARTSLPLTLLAGAPSFQASGGSTGFEVAVDDINTFAAAAPLCPLSSMPDSCADGTLEPELAMVQQANGCVVTEGAGQLRVRVDAATVDAVCRVSSRRSFSLTDSSLTVALSPLALRMDGVDPPGSYLTIGVELGIDGTPQVIAGLDARTPFCAAPSYTNTGVTLDAVPAALRVRAAAGRLHCETLSASGVAVSDLSQPIAAPVERVTPTFFVRATGTLPEAIDLGISIVPNP